MQDLATQLEVVRPSTSVYSLHERAFLRITGADATRWLNGMVTNSIRDLRPFEGNYNFLLNAQGRIEGDCVIYRAGSELAGSESAGSEPADNEPAGSDAEPEFLLSTTAAQIDHIEALLERFIIMDDVELARVLYIDGILPTESGLGVLGAEAGTLLGRTLQQLNQVVVDLPAAVASTGHMFPFRNGGHPFVVFAPPAATGLPSFEVWSQNSLHLEIIRENLLAMGAQQLSTQAVEALRICDGQPKYGVDIRNDEHARDLPQETAQTYALHFAKGCYLGQEIVERIRSRGQVHRVLTRFRLQGSMPTLPEALQTSIAGQTRPAGELTSAVDLDGSLHALGYVRREFATQPLTYTGGTATVIP